MNYLPSNLEFKDGVAYIGETSLLDVAKEYGTPLYVYDCEHLKDNIDYFTNAFGEDTYFRYAAKAFICKALVKELDDKRLGSRCSLWWRDGNSPSCYWNFRKLFI